MNVKNIREASDWFEVLQTTKRNPDGCDDIETRQIVRQRTGRPQGQRSGFASLGGEVKGEIADETITLREGDVIVIPAGTRHKFSNCSSADTVTFNTYSPPEY